MPVRMRKSRRRDVRAEKEAWAMFFQSGFDFFHDLPDIGVETNQHGVPAEEVAREAWGRLGRRYLDEFQGEPGQHGHYGVRVFGEPGQ